LDHFCFECCCIVFAHHALVYLIDASHFVQIMGSIIVSTGERRRDTFNRGIAKKSPAYWLLVNSVKSGFGPLLILFCKM